MSRKSLIALILVLALALCGALGFVVYMERAAGQPDSTAAPSESTASQTDPSAQLTQSTSPAETAQPATEAVTEPSQATQATEATEPQAEVFTLTFVGDCTLGSTNEKAATRASFISTVGEDYDYPFANVRQYFESDDFTFANLECVLSDEKMYSSSQFAFRGPTAYTQILTGSSVEAVTLANNHTADFGDKGLTHTKDALDAAGVAWVEKDGSCLYETERGLTVGMYAVNFNLDTADMKAELRQLRDRGAEVIIVAFHWGTEGSYRPSSAMVSYAHAAIDAGADIVYGSHPHVLQKVERYGDGIIYYSMSNFSFGGNNFPQDYDTAVVRQEIIREPDGTVRLGELTLIPCSVSSMEKQNNFQPTPYAPGTEDYDRCMSKLDGTFTGPNLKVEYEKATEATSATEAATQAPAEPEAPATQAPAEPEAPATQAPAEPEAPATQAPAEPEAPAPQPESGGSE